MKNTGVSQRPVSCHGAAIYATYRSFSAARLSDILPGSYLFRAISRFIAVLARHSSALHASFIIIKENLANVKPIFSVFYENMKIFLEGWIFFQFFRNFGGKPPVSSPFGPPKKRGGALPSSLFVLNKPRPSRCRWCTSCRTRGRCPRCRSAPGACSGS